MEFTSSFRTLLQDFRCVFTWSGSRADRAWRVGRWARPDQQGPALSQQGGQGGQGGQLFHTSRCGPLALCGWHGATTTGGGCHSKNAKDAKNANFFTRRDAGPSPWYSFPCRLNP